MAKKKYLNLLILSGILFQGIIEASSKENIHESDSFHVRKKRVVDLEPGGNKPVSLFKVPYMVNIKKNGFINCAGAIVSEHHILTANSCVDEELKSYTITTISYEVEINNLHVILRKIDHISDNFVNELALLLIDPPIDFIKSRARKIDLLIGPVPPNTNGTISGWGMKSFRPSGLESRNRNLRRIRVPIISQQECADLYKNHFNITDRHVCTFDGSRQKYCSPSDYGTPLVAHSQVAGVLIFAGQLLGHGFPDVFLNMDYHIYSNWIMAIIEPPNPHHVPYPHNPYIMQTLHNLQNPESSHNPHITQYPSNSHNSENPHIIHYNPHNSENPHIIHYNPHNPEYSYNPQIMEYLNNPHIIHYNPHNPEYSHNPQIMQYLNNPHSSENPHIMQYPNNPENPHMQYPHNSYNQEYPHNPNMQYINNPHNQSHPYNINFAHHSEKR